MLIVSYKSSNLEKFLSKKFMPSNKRKSDTTGPAL
nr:MAG TPA: hypothetical protein [Caudoviricetes sp.]